MRLSKSKKFYENFNAKNVKKIKKYREKQPLFIKEKIEEKLNEIYDTRLNLIQVGTCKNRLRHWYLLI